MTVLAPAQVEPLHAAQGWEVLTVCTPGGFVESRAEGGGLAMVVGDLDRDSRARAAGSTSAWLGRGGAATLVCLSAPPVLWLGAHGHRLAPDVPSRREELHLAPGDLLVLCSSDVLEHLDRGLPHLAGHTEGLADPGSRARALAADIGTATPAGAAVVAVWAPRSPLTSSTTATISIITEEETP